MGFLAVTNICLASFFLGILFTSLLWDSMILWPGGKITEATIGAVESYYLTWWNGAMVVKMFLHVAALVMTLCLAFKIAGKSETAYTFGGGSLLLVVMAVAMYMSITLPTMRTIAKDPLFPGAVPYDTNDLFSRVQAYWAAKNTGALGDAARTHQEYFHNREPMTFQERLEGLSVMCAGNTIAIMLLIGVLALQIGDLYVEETIIKEADKEQAARVAAAATPVTAEKKKQ